ncbi:unnamed protein product, partial [Nesidiocoris tenuis]
MMHESSVSRTNLGLINEIYFNFLRLRATRFSGSQETANSQRCSLFDRRRGRPSEVQHILFK